MSDPKPDKPVLLSLDQIKVKWRKRGRDADDPECQAEVLATVRTHIGMGTDDGAILEAMDCTPSELRKLKEQLYTKESNNTTQRPAEEVFLTYKWRMDAVIDQLQDITTKAKTARQFNAAMGAQKAIAQTLDDVMNRGQEMGVIARAAKKTEVVGGLVVAHLSGKELLDAVRHATDTTRRLVDTYSPGSMAELEVGDVYEDALEVPERAPLRVVSTDDEDVPAISTVKVGAGSVTRKRK